MEILNFFPIYVPPSLHATLPESKKAVFPMKVEDLKNYMPSINIVWAKDCLQVLPCYFALRFKYININAVESKCLAVALQIKTTPRVA